MTTPTEQDPDNQPIGTLVDFVQGYDEDHPLDVDVVVNEQGKVVVFHNLPFKQKIAWYEFDLTTCKLDFVLDDGEMRDAGLPLTRDMSKNMQNSHQILTVLLDDETGEGKEGHYVPLIIHQSKT